MRIHKFFFSLSTKRKKYVKSIYFFQIYTILDYGFGIRLTDFITTKERRHPFGKLDWKAHYACLSNFFTPIPSSQICPPKFWGKLCSLESRSDPDQCLKIYLLTPSFLNIEYDLKFLL